MGTVERQGDLSMGIRDRGIPNCSYESEDRRMKTAPCKGCEQRHPGCHSECERYAEYSNERAEMLKSKHCDNDYAVCHDGRVVKNLLRKKMRGGGT